MSSLLGCKLVESAYCFERMFCLWFHYRSEYTFDQEGVFFFFAGVNLSGLSRAWKIHPTCLFSAGLNLSGLPRAWKIHPTCLSPAGLNLSGLPGAWKIHPTCLSFAGLNLSGLPVTKIMHPTSFSSTDPNLSWLLTVIKIHPAETLRRKSLLGASCMLLTNRQDTAG